ncbi:lasso peptide biosynthesis B2 protein [Rubrivivax gelatinosus]|uniref:Microcin J25-processing protein McjB C-terminal domain-containing protein n=1 Tax=Rubrivivax gelatinosus (strain NBRC 100245 / IL144) TaxID=983917 RepID=I0HM06_RUBGI|nr:lasso peptide biosynthesis B2 protein [Rubrivivax gelatinosus]BAL94043.1 hypothetical protein RGE_06980 [Rubrivivax gelatinosus IL144]
MIQPAPTSPRALSLAPHVRACATGGQVILLDLRSGTYLGLAGDRLAALAGGVAGWPNPTRKEGETAPTSIAIYSLVRPLLARGLLVEHLVEPAPIVELEEPRSALDTDDAIVSVRTKDVGRFIHAAGSASAWLRWHSLLWIVEAATARRGTNAKALCDFEALRHAVARYDKLRPLAFAAQDRCLYDSLALLLFLASEGHCPRWVVGVRTRPFAAHSWVQSGSLVLNDQAEHVRAFSPILVV